MKKISRGTMMTLLLSSMVMVAFNIQAAVSPEPPETEWEWTYGDVGQDQLSCVIQCSDGGYVLAGSTWSFGAGGVDMWMAKIDSARNIMWSRPYGDAGHDGLGLHGCVKTMDGGYALAGYTESYGAGGRDVWLVKTDADGNMEWDETYGRAGWEEAISLIQTDDEGYAMAGYTESFGAGGADFWLIKTDSSGIEEWNRTYGGVYSDWAFSLIRTSDGGFAMTGWKQSYAGAGPHRGRDAWLVKTNSTGDMEWNQSYGEAGYADDQGYSVTQTDDGGYAIAGHTRSFGAARYDWLLLRTDSLGNLRWAPMIYGGAYDDYAHFIRQTGDEGFLIVGVTQVSSVGGSFDGWLMKTDSTGQIEWDQTFGEADVRDGLNRVIETADGGYALAGSKGGPFLGSGDFDFWLIKLAPEEIPATVDIDPNTLNLKSKDEFVTAYVELPEGYDVADIVLETVYLDGIPAVTDPVYGFVKNQKSYLFDRDGDGTTETRMVKFDRQAVIALLSVGEATLTITGEVNSTRFEGSDTIKVVCE